MVRFRGALSTIGPGIAIAATGVGAGDLLAAMLAGANFGTALAWLDGSWPPAQASLKAGADISAGR
jgi:hypothetical protein